ncbi:hypothetical protein ST47_g811 [Ascochyta rabiei]|uniref:Uncharacterized protein n=1 Tax=Didymella rabiei TaxID=5454 RepID=A0A163LRY8_DIDRA|nr:hypothetical protein ST47_g811 [Ascochyta rabiei]
MMLDHATSQQSRLRPSLKRKFASTSDPDEDSPDNNVQDKDPHSLAYTLVLSCTRGELPPSQDHPRTANL